MEKNSLVECIQPFDGYTKHLAWLTAREKTPEPGETFVVEFVERCECDQHDNLALDSRLILYDARHFKEIQTPGEGKELIEQLEERRRVELTPGEVGVPIERLVRYSTNNHLK